MSGDYESAGFSALDSLLEPGMTFFDVGASFGLYSLAAAVKVGLHGRVYAFEPTRSAAAALRDHISLNGFEDRARVVEAVVDEQSGTVEFHEPTTDWVQGTNMMASLSEQWVAARRTFAPGTEIDTFSCPAVSVDDFCAEVGILPDVLKIDVEGAEGRVLRGARSFLSSKTGRILLETHEYALRSLGDSEASVLAGLEEAGWEYDEVERKSAAADILNTAQFVCVPRGERRTTELRDEREVSASHG